MTDTSDIDEQLRKHEGDDNSQTVDVKGASITQVNQLSTWVILGSLGIVLLAIALLGLGLLSVGNQAALATGIANQAEREAQNAEREARVAINKAEELNVEAKVNEALIQNLQTTVMVKGK